MDSALTESVSAGGSTGSLKMLQPHIKKVWAIKLGLVAMALATVALTVDVLRIVRFLPFGALTAIIVVTSAVLVSTAPRLRYRFWRYALRETELYLEHGIMTRVRTIVPLVRIQHLDISQDVIEREFGVARLIVHTAGTRSSDVVVPGLTEEEAERMRESVRRYIADESL